MSSFNDIRNKIAAEVAAKALPNPGTASIQGAALGSAPVAAGAMMGTVVSRPGTEKIVLDASTFQFMECTTSAAGMKKPRYCIVEKGVSAAYGNQFINAAGERVHIVTKEVFNLMFGVVRGAGKQIQDLNNKLVTATEQRDLYKLTIDALRKNGIID